MQKLNWLSVVLSFFLWATPGVSSDLNQAKLVGAVGETSHLFLYPENCLYIHPFYNDVNGATDKFLTGSMKVGLLKKFSEFHLDSALTWRMMTPSIRESNAHEKLESAVGRYADWLELKAAVALPLLSGTLDLKQQISLGYSHIGDKGGKQLHRSIHEITRNSLENTDYTNQPEGYFFTLGYALTKIFDYSSKQDQQFTGSITAGLEHNKVLVDTYIEYSVLYHIKPKWWSLAFEAKWVRQLNSEIYTAIEPYRYELSAGTALYSWFAPTLKYVSNYIRGDSIGQTYFDFIHYNIAF